MAWRQQKRDVLDVQVYGVTFLLYRCILSHTLGPLTAQIASVSDPPRRRKIDFAMCRRDRRCGC